MLAGCNLLSGAGDLVTADAPATDGPEPTPPGPQGDGGRLEASSDAAVGTDDASGIDADASSDAADAARIRPPGGRFVFVTSTSSNGNLSGLAGADLRCNTLAVQAGLGGEWRAWLSVEASSIDAIVRLVPGGPWYLVDGTRVVGSKAPLAQDSLEHAIDRDETGTLVEGQRVWTGTRGGIAYFGDCNGWKTTSTGQPGTVGNTSARGEAWTAELPIGCSATARLYCFEK